MRVRLRTIGSRKIFLALAIVSATVLCIYTLVSVESLPADLYEHTRGSERNTFVDRHDKALNVTFENRWNTRDVVRLHDVPPLLQRAFILSEDKRFYAHGGVDWRARVNAAWQNLMAGKSVRGASTITEQVVRMIKPRRRTLWSRWLEGFEAMSLERAHSKLTILEFYLNQVPYAARRRGVVQAARLYFDRDIGTLNEKEMLALAILVRSPSTYDPGKPNRRLARSIGDLAERLAAAGLLTVSKGRLAAQTVAVRESVPDYNVAHFLAFANDRTASSPHRDEVTHTTIDLELQNKVQHILDNRLDHLARRHVQNGAVLVVDHETNEILSWAVGHAGREGRPFNELNAVVVKRQPGSALKPLLYTSALLQGWTAATLLDDSPLQESVGLGMHTYHNYSRAHYGSVSLREALGNSLNIPAVRAIQFVGPEKFLALLRALGVDSLAGHPNVYGDGLALGNGELTLYELVQAYTVLARMGNYKALSFIEGAHTRSIGYRVFSEDIASLVADILSDPNAREKEFGRHSILNFPYQTAVKTGTSSDYRDAWAIGFNDRYTVGVWMGNMDYSDTHEVTGSTGPALALRAVFNELNKNREVRPLYLSAKLVRRPICIETGLMATVDCESRDEWFVPGTRPQGAYAADEDMRLRKPSQGLLLAMDPRIPDEHEYFQFALSATADIERVNWFVNEENVATTKEPTFLWQLSRGQFTAYAEVLLMDAAKATRTRTVSYTVH